MSNSPAERYRIAGEAEPVATPLADPRDAALAKAREAIQKMRSTFEDIFYERRATKAIQELTNNGVDDADIALAALDAAKGAK